MFIFFLLFAPLSLPLRAQAPPQSLALTLFFSSFQPHFARPFTVNTGCWLQQGDSAHTRSRHSRSCRSARMIYGFSQQTVGKPMVDNPPLRLDDCQDELSNASLFPRGSKGLVSQELIWRQTSWRPSLTRPLHPRREPPPSFDVCVVSRSRKCRFFECIFYKITSLVVV